MTTPLHPPGLSLSHLSSRLALSTPSILSSVLTHLVELSQTADVSTSSYPPHFPALRAASLVARTWADTARPLLHRTLVFAQGDGQMRAWVRAVDSFSDEGEGAGGMVNWKVRFLEKEQGEEVGGKEGGGKKWSREVLEKVMRRVRGVRMLVFEMPFVKGGLPGEVLLHEGLKDLMILATACPFTLPPLSAKPPSQPPFKLRQFSPVAINKSHPASAWHSTENFHASPFEPFFFPSLAPCAHSLVALSLPALTLTPSSYRLALFCALSLPSLASLTITAASASAIRELLPYFARFAPALRLLAFRHFRVPLGAGVVPPHMLEFTDPAAALADVLSAWPTRKEKGGQLALVELGNVRVKESSVQPVALRIGAAAKRVGAMVKFVFADEEEGWEMGLSADETLRLADMQTRAREEKHKEGEVAALLAGAAKEEETRGGSEKAWA
ncbi:hypothetical protein JCM6882_000608 [Rhodosporidiobolus microsporus]